MSLFYIFIKPLYSLFHHSFLPSSCFSILRSLIKQTYILNWPWMTLFHFYFANNFKSNFYAILFINLFETFCKNWYATFYKHNILNKSKNNRKSEILLKVVNNVPTHPDFNMKLQQCNTKCNKKLNILLWFKTKNQSLLH